MEPLYASQPIPIPPSGAALRFLYHTAPGRLLLKLLSLPGLSRACGRFLDSYPSLLLVKGFMKKNDIHPEDCSNLPFRSFNDCFSRQLKPELRPVAGDPDLFVSPCDGLLRAYPITEGLVLPVKESRYTIDALLQDKELAARYQNGLCLVFRLCVNHYHRYCYPDAAAKSENVFIPGRLHTVRPIALRSGPVFTENSREYTLLETAHFGKVVQLEVGALLVGKIQNHHGTCTVSRGQEKGCFLYGGSTIILLLEPGQVELNDCYLSADGNDCEIPVQLGQPIGRAIGSTRA